MTPQEVLELVREYAPDLEVAGAVHLHDEDAWNKVTISYRGVIVGSELVDKEFVRKSINNYFVNRRNKGGP